MIRSMTGYARCVEVVDDLEISVEIKSLNSKYLNVGFSLPNFMSGCEVKLNPIVTNRVKRGKVSVKVHIRFLEPPDAVRVDTALARSYHDALEKLVTDLGIPEPVKLEDVLKFKDVIRFEMDENRLEKICESVGKVLERVVKGLIEEREREGERLSEALLGFLESIAEKIRAIESRADEVVGYYASALRERVKKIVPEDVVLDENILETVIAVIAERADIREEIDRLKSHVSRAKEGIESGSPIGAELDFLAQEMLREFNTILSKTRSLEISNLALDSKVLVNSFREQVQNVE